ncbi:MAG: VOC family protein [Proteobacteria bacterium]|nr:VOC family protein [Pseudomonadota bacterium]
MIKCVKLASIPVRDQKKAVQFYTEKLGFSILTDQAFDDSQRWVELGLPGAQTRVVLFTPTGHEGRIGDFTGITFQADDVVKTHKELKAKGVQFVHPPKKEPWGTYTVFKDLDGNQFCLSSN